MGNKPFFFTIICVFIHSEGTSRSRSHFGFQCTKIVIFFRKTIQAFASWMENVISKISCYKGSTQCVKCHPWDFFLNKKQEFNKEALNFRHQLEKKQGNGNFRGLSEHLLSFQNNFRTLKSGNCARARFRIESKRSCNWSASQITYNFLFEHNHSSFPLWAKREVKQSLRVFITKSVFYCQIFIAFYEDRADACRAWKSNNFTTLHDAQTFLQFLRAAFQPRLFKPLRHFGKISKP